MKFCDDCKQLESSLTHKHDCLGEIDDTPLEVSPMRKSFALVDEMLQPGEGVVLECGEQVIYKNLDNTIGFCKVNEVEIVSTL